MVASPALFKEDRPTPKALEGSPEAGTAFYPAIPVGGNAFLTAMTHREFRQVTYEPSVIYDRRFKELRDVAETLEVLQDIQRPVAGAKKKNIDSYSDYQVRLARKMILGLIPPRIVWTPELLTLYSINGCTNVGVPMGTRAYILDGETGTAASDKGRIDEPNIESMDIPVLWYHGLPIDFASQAHHDLNLLGTKPTIPVALNLDRRDPVTQLAKRIATTGALAGKVVMDKRQVSEGDTKDGKVMTLAALRGFVAGVALGKAAIGRATGPVQDDEIRDMNRLAEVTEIYAGMIADDPVLAEYLTDRDSMLSVGAVQVVVGSLGHSLLIEEPDSDAEDALDAIVKDLASVKWDRGERWNGIGGKVNPETGVFSVGGSKEYGYSIRRALTDTEDAGYARIRG